MRGAAARLLRSLDLAVETVATTAFVLMFAATLLQVLVRYVLLIPVPWTEELARVLFTCAMLLGIAVAVRRDEHIRVDALAERLPPRGRAALQLAFDVLLVLILLMLVWGAVRMMQVTSTTRMISIGWMRVGYLYAFQLGALTLMLLYLALRLPSRIAALIAGERAQGPADAS